VRARQERRKPCAEDRKEQVALFRYSVITEGGERPHVPPERGPCGARPATQAVGDARGRERFISRTTIDRWVGAYPAGTGLSASSPNHAPTRPLDAQPRAHGRGGEAPRQVPARSAAQIAEIIAVPTGSAWLSGTLREHSGAFWREPGGDQRRSCQGLRRYEASRRNEIWIGDVLIGPFVPQPRKPGSKRAKLFVLVDGLFPPPRGREVDGGENTRAGQESAAGRSAAGSTRDLYLTTERHIVLTSWKRTCAVLDPPRGIPSPTNSWAGKAGKASTAIYVRRFLTEAEAAGIKSFEQIERRFSAWADRWPTHGSLETKAAPIARFLNRPAATADAQVVREAFRWS